MSNPPHSVRRVTWQRDAVRAHVLNRHDHPTAIEVHASLKPTGIGLATVYRHLATMVAEGTLRSVRHQGEVRYDPNTSTHAHASCMTCGSLWDVTLPEQIIHDRPDGLRQVTDVQLTYSGQCGDCC